MSPTHPYVSLDQQISNKAVNLFEDLMEVIKPSPFEKLRRLIGDLRKSATAAVDKARVDQANAGDDVFGDGTSAELDPFEGEIGFPELVDVDGEGLGSMELDGLFDPFVVPAGRGLPTAFGPL